MGGPRRSRDKDLIDAIEAIPPVSFAGTVWRIVGDGRDPLRCSASGGRWDDGTFSVLYTSLERQGAIAELRFHLMRGQPVFPSRVRYKLFAFDLSLGRALKLLDLEALAALKLDTQSFGRLSYAEKAGEYPRTQDIAEVAHFLDFDGLIVPSARYQGHNAVVFCEKTDALVGAAVTDHGLVDWSEA